MKRITILLIVTLFALTACASGAQGAAAPLSLVKYASLQQEWDGELLLAHSEYSCAVLSEECAAEYPALAEMLEQTRNMAARAMEDEFDNLKATAREELQLLGAGRFVTKSSALDVQIRRADSVAVSLLSDSTLVYGRINDRFLHGTTYDTATGRQLQLTDIITDMEKIPAIVKAELQRHSWTGDFASETAVEDYFGDTPADGIAWTLDYNGVTFYFADGDLAELGSGRLAATVSFAEHPELFDKKYTAVPASYMVELPLNHPFYTDLDGDGASDELSLSPVPDDGGLFYASFDVDTDTHAQHYSGNLQANRLSLTGGYHPYYVKTADGRQYLYVFAEGSEYAAEDMTLRVIDLTGGTPTAAGDLAVGPGYVPVDGAHALTDPENMMFENFELMQEAQAHRVGGDGMPSRR